MICVNSVTVYPKSISLKVGNWSYAAYAEVCPCDADCKEVVWHSTNPSVASVNAQSGYIYANAVGGARIYATATDGSCCSDFLTVTVRDTIPVSSVTLDRTSLALEVGKSTTLFATVCPDNASYKNLSWTSSDSCVATVSGGVVTAMCKGSATITATALDGSGKSASCNVTVTDGILVTSITVLPSTKFMTVGQSTFLEAIVCPSDATQKCVFWHSNNPSVATVNPDTGLVLARQEGRAYIYATACDGSGIVGSCLIRVNPPPALVEQVNVSPAALTLTVGQTATLSAEVLPENARNKTVLWTSNASNIVEVDVITGVITAKAVGSATITATAQDDSRKMGNCLVTVVSIEDNVEYHLLCNGDNTKALRVGRGNVFTLTGETSIRSEKTSYWKRQKWVLQSFESEKKLLTQLNNNYYLCNSVNNAGCVSNSATDNNSNIVIIPHENSSELYEIKLANSDLYLTFEYNSSDGYCLAKWQPKDTSNISNQVWKFVEQPTNLHNGIDTGKILNETTIQSLKSNDTEFVIRYYKLLDTLRGVELFTKGSEEYNGTMVSRIDATISKLKEQGIDLDVENYLGYADTISITDNNLFITGNGQSLVTDEKNRYLQHDINIVSVYQNDGTKYEYFTEKHAKLDALSALMSAKLLGQPYGSAIYFAVDYDANNDELDRIKNYFDVIKNKIGGRYKIGVYGSGLVCSTIKPTYAAYSWLGHSTGHRGYENYDDTTKYNIKQAEELSYNGITVDYDVAVGNDYGQW